jgi:hypothetical protein
METNTGPTIESPRCAGCATRPLSRAMRPRPIDLARGILGKPSRLGMLGHSGQPRPRTVATQRTMPCLEARSSDDDSIPPSQRRAFLELEPCTCHWPKEIRAAVRSSSVATRQQARDPPIAPATHSWRWHRSQPDHPRQRHMCPVSGDGEPHRAPPEAPPAGRK